VTPDLFATNPAWRLPRWAVLPGIGRVRVLEYVGNGRFVVLDNTDEKRLVHRDRLTFTKR